MEQLKFKRYELKYLVTEEQYSALLKLLDEYAEGDIYGKTTICNVYYDTPSFLLIRRSIEKPVYKEKLRVRCYGVPHQNSRVFVELKKKFKSVVFKRRVKLTLYEAEALLAKKQCAKPSQVTDEILYFLDFYKDLQPAVCIFCQREAFYGKDDADLRITFDSNILFRDYDLRLTDGIYGEAILPEGYRLLEVKTAKAVPLWLSEFFTKEKIYKTSFSKYGTAYLKIAQRRK